METIVFQFIDGISKIGFTGLLIILAFPTLRQKFFGTNGGGAIARHEIEIQKLCDHARIANGEMGQVNEKLARIETDIGWIRQKLKIQ